MVGAPLKHIVFLAGPSGSHLGAAMIFNARLINKFPNAYISLYTIASCVVQAEKYLGMHSESVRERLRIVVSDVQPATPLPTDAILAIEKGFNEWILKQIDTTPFDTGKHTVAPPSCIIEDFIHGGIGLMEQERHKLTVVPWWPGAAGAMLAQLGNEENGNGSRLSDRMWEAMSRQKAGDEKPFEELYKAELSDRVIHVPGLPPFYEHETVTQFLPQEPIVIEACTSAFSRPLKPFCIGPALDLPPAPAAKPDSTDEFLDKAYAELGPRSVIYMAFGGFFFPLLESAHHLEIIIDQIVAQGFRLVFSLSSPFAHLDQSIKDKITKGGNVILPSWANQLKVLEHPATHYFISHGGWNSTAEAILRGVPIIFWPFALDQTTNAAHVAKNLDCGFELIQVRTGPAKSKAYPDILITGSDEAVREEINNVLEMSKGAKGLQQRLNMKALGQIMRKSIQKGGSGDRALEELGHAIGF
ncbi:glycosyltransferase family 1 protein [Ceratobasidium sp. AG-Ba]|nr:glycosyltransferase family 1 protein [Ceratobasidium sp. AG-Ba]